MTEKNILIPRVKSQRWPKGGKKIQTVLIALGVMVNAEKLSLFFHKGGNGLRELFNTIPIDRRAADDHYDTAIRKLDNMLKELKNVTKEHKKFLDIKQLHY